MKRSRGEGDIFPENVSIFDSALIIHCISEHASGRYILHYARKLVKIASKRAYGKKF